MIPSILLGITLMTLCLLVQVGVLVAAVHYYLNHKHGLRSDSIVPLLGILAVIMGLLVAGNLAQGALWAAAFMLVGEFARFADAYYHSLVNFATLGYGDIVMSREWRLLGPLQAINGGLMIGVSTATIGAVLNVNFREVRAGREARPPSTRPRP